MTAENKKCVLGSLIEMQKGYAFKSNWYSDSGRKIVKVSNFTENSVEASQLVRIPESIAEEYSRYKLKRGDVIVQTVGSWPSSPKSVVGKAVRIPNEVDGALLNQNAVKLVPRDKLDRGFLFYLLQSERFKNYIVGTAQGAAKQASITLDSIRNFSLSLPKLSVQRKIAAILSEVDHSIEKSREIVGQTQQLKKGLMQQLLTRGIAHTAFKLTEVGEIPEEWEIFSLGGVAEVSGGATPSTKIVDYWNGEIPFVTPTDVTNLEDGNTLTSTEKSITKAGFNSISAKCVPAGSVLVTSRATIGKCCINAIPVVTNQGFINLVCKSELYNFYALYLARSLKKEFERLSDGSTFRELARKSARKVRIALPPLSEQKKSASILLTLDEKIKAEKQRNELLHYLKRGLADALLTGKVRVKVT